MSSAARRWTTPRDSHPGTRRIESRAGIAASILPIGCLQALEYRDRDTAITLSQVHGSPLDGGIQRIWLRVGGSAQHLVQLVGPGAEVEMGLAPDRCAWVGTSAGLRHRVTLELHPTLTAWRWRISVVNESGRDTLVDALIAQDLGLGPRGFLMNNEAYVSQYIDHHVEHHERFGPVVMSRQNLAQDGRHPWVAQFCPEGAAAFATDAMQVYGPNFRDAAEIDLPFGRDLPGTRLQHEVACVALQSRPVRLGVGESREWSFAGLYVPDHPAASGAADLASVAALAWDADPGPAPKTAKLPRSLVQDAPPLAAEPFDEPDLAGRYPVRMHEERPEGALLSFFVPDGAHNRHVVLAGKERLVPRRHGALLRSGSAILPDEATLCSTAWMHGVFSAQLTIGNTGFHKLFSVSRDPYGITRSSGLRILADTGLGWRLLAIPSVFEIGLSDCRWIYRTRDRTITVHAAAAGDDPAMQWRVSVEGAPCRFLIFGHLVLGERELDHASTVELDAAARRFTFRPDPAWLWGQRYPDAAYHLVTSTPDAVEATGGDELLYADGVFRDGAYIALRSRVTAELRFAVTGSLTDAAAGLRLAERYAAGVDEAAMLDPAELFWDGLIGGRRTGEPVFDTLLPWLAHDAIIHVSVPHGLEQYTGAAWGTRDVCQGPVEFLLALGRPQPVKEILRKIFAQQYAGRGDWPQWFMLEPYSIVQDRSSHGDVIVWPLKALNDYVEETGDLALLDEPVAWRDPETLETTRETAPVARHVDTLIETVRARFIPGTSLIRLGEGDWNDSLQPADPNLRNVMVSSWTVALLYQQIRRYADIVRRAGRDGGALDILADAMAADFNRWLMRDGLVAGYAIFGAEGAPPALLIHPSDTQTGLSYSLLPMTQGIISGLFTAEQATRHVELIRRHLLCPDGARLVDRPPAYRGGPEILFRRAESASYVGREIGLMYVHSHLRWAEALALQGDFGACREALLAVNPIAVTERLPQARPRQRNCYFSSSDAAFPDRYAAAAGWDGVYDGSVGVDGGWRIYSSGPGLFTNLLLRQLRRAT
jgi:cellobiose phosphorylase